MLSRETGDAKFAQRRKQVGCTTRPINRLAAQQVARDTCARLLSGETGDKFARKRKAGVNYVIMPYIITYVTPSLTHPEDDCQTTQQIV